MTRLCSTEKSRHKRPPAKSLRPVPGALVFLPLVSACWGVPLDPSRYTGRHVTGSGWVQLIAYERRDGPWDLFVFEPPGVCPPEWEGERTDGQHLRLGELSGPERMAQAIARLNTQLGPDYEPTLLLRESTPGQRTKVNRGLHLLHHGGATGYSAQLSSDGHWELHGRRKDRALLDKLH